MPIIPTPFDPETEAVDYAALGRLVEFAAGRDFGAICLPAYASEFYKLDEGETWPGRGDGHRGPRRGVCRSLPNPTTRRPASLRTWPDATPIAAADLISFAIPRQFALTDDDLFDYCGTIMGAVTVPVLIQDFNPGGPSMSPALCARLHAAHQNFHYVKLEEPLLGHKIAAMREATQDQIGVLIGWGGMYLMELLGEGNLRPHARTVPRRTSRRVSGVSRRPANWIEHRTSTRSSCRWWSSACKTWSCRIS